MRKNVKIIIGIGFFLILAGGVIFSFQSKINLGKKSETSVTKEGPIKEVTLIVDFGEGKIERFNREIEEGMTAFDLLKEGTSESKLVLKTKSYDIGIFIEAIGDKENGQEKKYWMYYVNGEMPMVAADKKEIKPKDKVEFKFEKSSF